MATFPYEDISNVRRSSSPRVARETLTKGWERKGGPTLRLDQPIPWSLTEDAQRSWNFQLHSWDMIDGLLKAFCLTGDRRFFGPAVAVIEDWIASGDAADSPNPWYDMAVGLRAYRLAYVIEAGVERGLLTPQAAGRFRALLERHRIYLADDANIVFHNNHGFYQVAGQIAMARRFPDQQGMAESLAQGQARLSRLMDVQFAPDGVHKEHSPDYHRMLALTLKGLVDAGLVTEPAALERIDGIERALSWFATPQGDLANFGDTDIRSLITGPENATARWRTPEMWARATNGEIGAAPTETVRAFDQGGYFVVRKPGAAPAQDSYLAQTAAFHSRTHRHADDLSFVWHDHGTPILVDAGRYGYFGHAAPGTALARDGYWYSEPNRVFVETTRAHNCLEFDGRNNPRKDVTPYGSALRGWAQTDNLVVSETHLAIGTLEQTRFLVFCPGRWLAVVDRWRDRAWRSHQARQWFHAHPDFVTRPDGDGYRMEGPATVHVAALNGARAGPVIRGQTEPMQGWMSPRERVMQPNDAFAFQRSGRSGAVATLFAFGEIDRAASRLTRIRGGVALRLAIDGTRREVRVTRDAADALVLS